MARLSVLMCSEGTYPYHQGGVSVWCDQLIQGLPEVDFHVFAITRAPNRKPVFQIPSNVIGLHPVSLWGRQEPGCSEDGSFVQICERKARTTSSVIGREFLKPFSEIVNCVFTTRFAPEKLGQALLSLHVYFKRFDFAKSMTSPEAWTVFLQACEHSFPDGQKLSVHEATMCMRWMQRFLGILSAPLPRTDISHSSIAGLASVPGVLNKLLHGSPFLLTEHGIYLRELYLWLMRTGYTHACRRFLVAFNEAIVKMNYHFADQVTALGTFNKAWQVRLGASEGKIAITPNGVDPKLFRPVIRPVDGRPVVLTMARIHYIKGIEFLLRAAAIVRPRVPSVLFRVLGEPANLEYFRRCQKIVADHGLQGTVEFGSTEEPASAYPDADIFCLPSVSEGMPYSILEAMFSGCAIVATDVGNVSEMLAETGIIVRPADPEALAQALLTLLEGGEAAHQYRSSLAKAALKRAQSLYTSDRAVDRFRDLYQSLTYDRHIANLHTAAC
jgi:glycosyltransferase involved in cell wall biosynthesis